LEKAMRIFFGADACAGILSENEFSKERVCLTGR
jgi:hypothetical protein